jgi:hypothetical protein
MSTDKEKKKYRSAPFLLTAQLDGLCFALRQAVPNGLTPGKTTIDLLKKFHKDFLSMHSGGLCEGLPEITDSISAFDMLVYAETLRSVMMAFLTPEETEDYNKSFGFVKRDE